MKLGTLRAAAGLALVTAAVAGMAAAQGSRSEVTAWVEHLLSIVQAAGPLGWLAFAALQALVAAVGIVPASLLGISAGLTYGVWLGFLLSAAGTLVGGWTAFQLSRSLLRPWIAQLLEERLQAAKLDNAIAQDSWRFVCLMRISPVMPFAATSYALGLTRIRQQAYLLGTLASLPALLGYVVLGALANEGLSATLESAGPLRWGMFVVGVVATGLATLRIGRMLTATGLMSGILLPGMKTTSRD